MKKIHKIEYGKIFSYNFKVDQIDENLNNLEIEEQLRLLDHVIDYVYVNLKELKNDDAT